MVLPLVALSNHPSAAIYARVRRPASGTKPRLQRHRRQDLDLAANCTCEHLAVFCRLIAFPAAWTIRDPEIRNPKTRKSEARRGSYLSIYLSIHLLIQKWAYIYIYIYIYVQLYIHKGSPPFRAKPTVPRFRFEDWSIVVFAPVEELQSAAQYTVDKARAVGFARIAESQRGAGVGKAPPFLGKAQTTKPNHHV